MYPGRIIMSFDLKLTNGDIEISDGALVTVQNQDKLIQDVLKILFTATGENLAHPWYGTPMLARAIGESANSEILSVEIADAVSFGLNNLKTLQQLQERDSQFVTPQELIASIDNIDATFNQIDKRKLVVTVSIKTRSSEIITESFIIRV